MFSAKKVYYSILSLFLGLFLVWLVIERTPFDLNLITEQVSNLNYIYLIAILVTSFLNIWITAYKWKLTTELILGKNSKNQNFYLTYITFGSLFGQFMPQQMSMMTIQSFAMKAHKISNVSKGLFTIIYDQIFNTLIPLLLCIPALLLIADKISISIAIFLSCCILFIAYYFIQKHYVLFMKAGVKVFYILKRSNQNNQKITETIQQLTVKKKFVSLCFLLSTVRYFNLVLRWIFVVLAGTIKIKLFVIAFATPIIYLAMLLSITPANLGIVEWSWLGVLQLFGVAEADALMFALLQRILFFISIVFIAICVTLVYLKQYYFKYKHN